MTKINIKNNRYIFKALAESSPDCIKLLDLAGNLIYLSPAGREEHGLKMDEDLKNFKIEDTLTDPYKDGFKYAFEEAKKGEETTLEVMHLHDQANREWCLMTISPVFDSNKNIVAIFGVSRDISIQKSNEKRIKRLSQLKSKFIKVVSHQLRTPHTSIRWGLENILDDDSVIFDPKIKDSITVFILPKLILSTELMI